MNKTVAEVADVLLVEDNPGDVRLLKVAFEEGDVRSRIHAVPSATEAMSFLRQNGPYADAPRPDLVLLDLNLPRSAPGEPLERIKNDPDLRRIPVIVLTSSDAEEDIVRCYNHQTNAYLTKPVDPDEYVSLVRTLEDFWLSHATLPPR